MEFPYYLFSKFVDFNHKNMFPLTLAWHNVSCQTTTYRSSLHIYPQHIKNQPRMTTIFERLLLEKKIWRFVALVTSSDGLVGNSGIKVCRQISEIF